VAAIFTIVVKTNTQKITYEIQDHRT